jgi:hypothetical protein
MGRGSLERTKLQICWTAGELATQLGRVYAARGYKGVQEWELETNLRAWRKNWVRAVDVAMAYSELGHNNEAFEWLQRAPQST